MLKEKNCVNYTHKINWYKSPTKSNNYFLLTRSCPAMSTKCIFNRIMANTNIEDWI